MKKILLTGGGTAGHVTPNMALLPKLRKLGFEVHYAGTRMGIEDKLITREGVPFHAISAGKLRRYFDMRNFTDLFLIAAGFFQSLALLMMIRPAIVFSKGGFVSCPVVWAAWLLRIPAVIHESDITPGLANRLSIPFAKKVCYSFPETAACLDKRKAVHTGLPVREFLLGGNAPEGRRICGFTSDKPLILVMGGSTGSKVLNRVLREALPELSENFNVCHICGRGNLGEPYEGYVQFEYVNDELPHIFAACHLFIGRAGATTLFELLAMRRPGLLIPLSSGASRGDQILNAASFERQGFSIVIKQEELSVAALVAGVKRLYEGRFDMVAAMKKSDILNGVQAVIDVILEASGHTSGHVASNTANTW